MKGQLAASWEMPDASTYLAHLRKGIHWQDIPPANGREFTADDVVFHFERMCGLGEFNKPKPAPHAAVSGLWSLSPPPTGTRSFLSGKLPIRADHGSVAYGQPDARPGKPRSRAAVGQPRRLASRRRTGPFILKDFVPGQSATLVKNKKYWGHDERYPGA